MPTSQATTSRGEARAVDRRTCLVLVVALTLLAVALRAWYVETHRLALFAGSDNTWYDGVARSFAEGHWGRVAGRDGADVFSGRFPPAYPLVLALGQRLLFWMPATRAHQWTSVACGTAGVACTVVLAWRLTITWTRAGRVLAAGVTGLLLAAHPLVIGASGALMSEALSFTLSAAFLLLVDVVTSKPRRRAPWLALGAVVSVAVLTRGEGLLFLGVPLAALVWVHRRSPATRTGLLAVLGAAVVVACAWSTVMSVAANRLVIVSTNSGSLVIGANCRTTLHGEGRGSWDALCPPPDPREYSAELRRVLARPGETAFGLEPQLGVELEAELSRIQLRTGLERAGDEPLTSLGTVPFRWARGLGLHSSALDRRLTFFEGRDPDVERAGERFHRVVLAALLGLAAALLLRRRGRPRHVDRALAPARRLLPAGLLSATWLVMLAATYGSARFRQPVEPVLATVVGLAVAALVAGRRRVDLT